MPSIKIIETDLTGSSSEIEIDHIVLIPEIKTDKDFNKEFTKSSDFIEEVVETVPTQTQKMVINLLDLGMSVRYATYEESGLSTFFNEFKDKGKYDLRFITSGMMSPTDAIKKSMIKCAAERGDAIALFNSDDGEFTSLSDISNDEYKYSACFAPKVKFPGETDEYPAWYVYLACFAKHLPQFASWFAFAGTVRGASPYEIESLSHDFGDAEIDTVQSRKQGHKGCNVIAEIRPYGKLVWGNRTLFPNKEEGELTASSFLNIRHLCCDIKKTLYKAARKSTFEPNDEVLWINFCGMIKPLLEKMKSGEGIRGYKLIKQASKRGQLKAIIRVIPIEAVEDFDLTVELADSIEIEE